MRKWFGKSVACALLACACIAASAQAPSCLTEVSVSGSTVMNVTNGCTAAVTILTRLPAGNCYANPLRPGASIQAVPTAICRSERGPADGSCNCAAGTSIDVSSVGARPAAPVNPMPAAEATAEVQEVKTECDASAFAAAYHDCTCVAQKFTEYRAAQGRTPPTDTLRGLAFEACPGKRQGVYDMNYKTCTDYMRTVRTDWEPFCQCSSNKVADAYVAKPVQNMRYIEGLKRDSFKACGLADRSHNIVR